MAKLVFGMNQSLDGYVDHMAFAPGPTLFRHFIEEAEQQSGSVYGRVMYEIMRYWDDDDPGWGADERAFAAAWRKQPKWVVSRTLKSVGPNAQLVGDDLEGAIRALKAERDGEIEVAGPHLAGNLTELGLIDEYRIYLHPVVLGHGRPYFAGPRPPLRLVKSDRIEDVIRLVYVPDATRETAPHAFVKAVHGVRYQVKDVERAVAFYTRHLGFTLKHQQLPAFANVVLGDAQILLSGPGASGSRPMPNGQQQEPGGWNRVVLKVTDLPGFIAELKKAGLRFRNDMETGPGGRQIQIEDPDGNPIELFEPAR